MEKELTIKEITNLVDAVPGDFVVYEIIGDKLKVVYYSETVLESFGVTAEEFEKAVSENALDVVMPGDREYALSTVAGKPVSNEIYHCMFRLIHSKRGFFWVHAKSRIIGTMNGNSIVLTNYTNMTTEAEVFGRNKEDTEISFFNVDMDTFEILYANRAAREHSRIEDGEKYAYHTCYEYFYKEDHPCDDCPILNGITTEDTWERETHDLKWNRWLDIVFKRVDWCNHDCRCILR